MAERIQPAMNSINVEQPLNLSFVSTWRFSLLQGFQAISQVFSLGDGMNGRLGLSDKKNSSGFFSLLVHITTPDSSDFDQFTYLKLSLMNHLNPSKSLNKYLWHRFNRNEYMCRISDFAKNELLSNPELGFVFENILEVKAEISFIKEECGYYYENARVTHIRSKDDEGYHTVYSWKIHDFESFRDIAKKCELDGVNSRSFESVLGNFHIVVYLQSESHFGIFLKKEDPYPPPRDQHFSIIRICIINKDQFGLSKIWNCTNYVRDIGQDKFGKYLFMSFEDLINPSGGFIDEGAIMLVAEILTIKESISKDRELLNKVYGIVLSGECVIWTVENFSDFESILANGSKMESQIFEAHGCELRAVISNYNSLLYASLTCKNKSQEDFLFQFGVWNVEGTIFTTSTFKNPRTFIQPDVRKNKSVTFIWLILDLSDQMRVLAETERNAELAKKRSREELTQHLRVIENLNGNQQSLEEQIRQLKGEVCQLVGEKEEKDGTITRLEIENGVSKENFNSCQRVLAETERNAELAKKRSREELTQHLRVIENLNGNQQSLEEQIRQLKGEVCQLVGEKEEKDGTITRLEIENGVSKENFNSCQENLKDVRRSLEEDIRQLNVKIGELDGEKKSKDEKISQFEARKKRELDANLSACQRVLAETERSAELAKKRSREELTQYLRVIENLNGNQQSLEEQIRQLKGEVWQLVGEKAEKDVRITRLEIENGVSKENFNFCQNKLTEERSISADLRGYGVDRLSEVEIDAVLRFHVQRVEQTYEIIKRRRLGGQH